MTPLALLPPAMIALAALVALARTLRAARGATPARRAILLAGQPVIALLLVALLAPAVRDSGPATLTIATEGTPAPLLGGGEAAIIALPDALPGWTGERAPDLASALRRHPEARRLRILGWGLAPDDRAAARQVAIVPALTPAPAGITGLYPPERAAPGSGFAIGVATRGLNGATIELLDPAGARIDRAIARDDAPAMLRATARAAGAYRFVARVARGGRIVESADVPLRIATSEAPRARLSGGAPSAEWKFLRRWASDAGMAVRASFATGAAVTIGDPDPGGASDLTLIDDRRWATMDGAARARLIEQVRGGMGLILRTSGAVPPEARGGWARLGIAVAGSGRLVPVRVERGDAADRERAELRFDGAAVPILRAADGSPLAAWRPLGLGRVAIVTLTDSYAWAQAGDPERHARFWSLVAAAVTRPSGDALPWPATGRVGRRVALCGLGADRARVVPPEGPAVTVLRDPATGARGCGGYWPRVPGWHRLARQPGAPIAFFVRPQGALIAERARERAAATRALAAAPRRDTAPAPGPSLWRLPPLPRWLWFLGWMLAAALLWWLERARWGRR